MIFKATLMWWQHWQLCQKQTLLSRTEMATHRFILLQKRVFLLLSFAFKNVCEGKGEVIALLIRAPGSNLSIKNNAGKTAEQLARYSSSRSNNKQTNNPKNVNMLRDGGHRSVLALIPGTMEHVQAENLALRESMRNMQAARIRVPECPVWVSEILFSLFLDSGLFSRDGASGANLPLRQRSLCLWRVQAWHSGTIKLISAWPYSFLFSDRLDKTCQCLKF